MKPLPKDDKSPLAGGVNADDLILWLAYKEARDLIKLDEKSVTGIQQKRGLERAPLSEKQSRNQKEAGCGSENSS
jgi:hypothetical protein